MADDAAPPLNGYFRFFSEAELLIAVILQIRHPNASYTKPIWMNELCSLSLLAGGSAIVRKFERCTGNFDPSIAAAHEHPSDSIAKEYGFYSMYFDPKSQASTVTVHALLLMAFGSTGSVGTYCRSAANSKTLERLVVSIRRFLLA